MKSNRYDHKDYKADLDLLVTNMSADELIAKSEADNEDNKIFLNEMACIKALAKAWDVLSKVESSYQLITAGQQLAAVYVNNKFSTNDYFPGVAGPRTLKLAHQYLSLLEKAMSLSAPQVGNFLTQPVINKLAEEERKDTQRCITVLGKLINDYEHKYRPAA